MLKSMMENFISITQNQYIKIAKNKLNTNINKTDMNKKHHENFCETT